MVHNKTCKTLRRLIPARHFKVYFNDVMLFEADDDAFRDPGNFGVWTSADSVTQFDDLVIKQVQQQQPGRK
jgi:hypothetical protein